jgi:thioredoxin-like negative regulator of GroEL
MQELTTQELKQKINEGENFILDLYATWCGPCKIMLENLKKVQGVINESKNFNFSVYKFDIESDKEFVVNELGIRSVPTIKFYKEGNEVFSNRGVMTPNEIFDTWLKV